MRAVYSISSRQGTWFVRLNGKVVGPAPSLLDAAKITVRSAEKAHAQGWHAHILVQKGSEYRTLWANGALRRELAA